MTTEKSYFQPAPAHTPGPWFMKPADKWTNTMKGFVQWGRFDISAGCDDSFKSDYYRVGSVSNVNDAPSNEANARLISAAPDLLAACINARDMLATDRQAYVDCQQLRDSRTEDPIAHGLVAVEDGVWFDADDAEALRDYDRAIELIDKATAKATGVQA